MRKHMIFVLLAVLAVPTMAVAQQQGQMQRQQQMERMQQMQQHMDQMIQRMGQVQERLQNMDQQMQSRMQGEMGRRMSQQQMQQQRHMQGVASSMQEMSRQVRSTMMQVRELARDPAMHQDGAMQQEMERLREHMQGIVDELVASTESLGEMQRRAGGGPDGGR